MPSHGMQRLLMGPDHPLASSLPASGLVFPGGVPEGRLGPRSQILQESLQVSHVKPTAVTIIVGPAMTPLLDGLSQ